jgi:O-antigen/teichoic acid export membrane protein
MWDELTKLIRHAAVYGVGRILSKGISLLLVPFYTYYLTPADYGVMEILNLTIMLAGVVVGLGLSSGLMRYYYATEDQQRRHELVSSALFFAILSAGMMTAPAFLFAGSFSHALLGSSRYAMLIRLAAAQFFFSLSSDIGWVYLRAKQRSGLYVTLTQLFLAISMGLTIYLVAARKMELAGVFWGNAVAAAFLWIILMAITIRETGLHFVPAQFKEMIVFGSPMIFTWIAAYVLNYSDRFFLQRFSDLSVVGVYSLAYKFGFMVSMLGVQPFLLIWEAQAYEIAKRDNAKEVFSRVFTYWSFVLISGGFLLSLFIREIFDVLVNQRFGMAYLMVAPIAFAYVIQGIGVYFEAGLLIQKKSKTIAAIGVVCTIICLVMESVLIYFWKSWGACVSTVLCFAVFGVANYIYSQREYPIHCDFKAVSKMASAGLALLAVGWLLPIHSFGWRIVAKLALTILFGLMILKLKTFPEEDVRNLRESTSAWTRRQVVPKLRWAGLMSGGSHE